MLKPYAELMFMDDRTIAQLAHSGNFNNTRTINCDNPLLSAQQLSRVCVNGNFVGQTPVFDDDGNLTILGSMANLIVAERAKARGETIGFWDYARVGIPVTLLTLAWGIACLALTSRWIGAP